MPILISGCGSLTYRGLKRLPHPSGHANAGLAGLIEVAGGQVEVTEHDSQSLTYVDHDSEPKHED